MRRGRTLSALACLAVACWLLLAGCTPPIAEVAFGPLPEPGGKIVVRTAAVANPDPYEAGKLAAVALRTRMRGTAPQAVLLSESFEDAARKEKVLEAICSVFPPESVFGMAAYGCFGQAGCLADDSVGLVAIGGKGISVSTALERRLGTARLSMSNDEAKIQARLHAAGSRLAQKLARRAKDRLLVILADAHSPKNRFLVEGVQKVLGSDFPIVGGCANKNAGQTYVYYRGRMFEDSAVGLMLTGDFKVGLAGRRATDNARVIATAKEAGAEALANLKAKPFAALAFNCAGRKSKLKNIADELAAIQAAIGNTLPLFGCYCAGEIGPPDKSERKPGVLSAGVGWHVIFAILGR